MNKNVAFILIGIGVCLMFYGLIYLLKDFKPFTVGAIASIIGVVVTAFVLYTKQIQDIASSDKTSNILKTSQETFSQITGGDSYCVVEVFFDQHNMPLFSLRHIGNTTLKNVVVSIEDYGRRVNLIKTLARNDWKSPLVPQINKETNYQIQLGVLHSDTEVSLNIPTEKDQDEIKMAIWINLDNGKYFETLKVENYRSEKLRRFEIELKKGEEILFKQ